MAGSPTPPALPEGEQRAAEALLTRALGEPAAVQAAEPLWDRGHVFRLHLAPGRAVILKRKRGQEPIGAKLFGDELAALDYLNAMPVPVAPRLLGADAQAGLLLMEDLGDGATLADSLMAAGRERVRAALIAYAQALGSLHAWSMGHAGEAAGLWARHGPGDEAGPGSRPSPPRCLAGSPRAGRDSHPGLPFARAGRLGPGTAARRMAAPAVTARTRLPR